MADVSLLPSTESTSKKVEESKWPPLNLALVAFLVSIGGGFNFGYQLLITNPAQEAFVYFLNSSYVKLHGVQKDAAGLAFIWGLIVSSFFWGATVGAFVIQLTADTFGRKMGMIYTFILQVVACAMTVASYFMTNYILYTVSRFLLGAAISISLGIAPLFINECSPASCRGIISLATGVMLQFALVVGSIVAMPQLLGTIDQWWLMYAAEGALTTVVTLLAFFIRESPSFLISQNKEDEARSSLAFYQPSLSAEDTDKAIKDMQNSDHGEEKLGLISIFKDPVARRGAMVGVIVMGGMILSGIAAINAFAFDILRNTGLNVLQASIGNIVICIMTVLGVLVSTLLIERWGRRPLLISTFSGIGLINIFIVVFMILFEHTKETILGWCVVVSICLFNFIFCIGPGPLSFFIAPELVGQHAKGAACTWINIVLNGIRSILLVIYVPVQQLLGGPYSYLVMYFPPCVLAAVLLYFYLPETKGRSPEEATNAIKYLPTLRKRPEYTSVETGESIKLTSKEGEQ